MILNNYEGMRFIRSSMDKRLTPDLILELHRTLMVGTSKEGVGRFRRPDEVIRVKDVATGEVLHTPPSAEELLHRIEAMCRFANDRNQGDSFVHPVIRAILLHFWLAYDHPFVDGNGRTARALFYWAMASQGYRLCEFISLSRVLKANRQGYRDAFLRTENDENDTTYFIVHQLEAINQAIDDLFDFLERKAQELHKVEEVIRRSALVKEHLNARQLALVSHAIRRANYRYTIDSHQNAHGVTYQTARTDLMKLEELGLLDKVRGPRKRLYFLAPPDLRLRLMQA
jgi:Fic family protein